MSTPVRARPEAEFPHTVAVLGVRGGVGKTAVAEAIARRAAAAGEAAVVCKPEAVRHELVGSPDGRVFPPDLEYLTRLCPAASPADVVPVIVRPVEGPGDVPSNNCLDRKVQVHLGGEPAGIMTYLAYLGRRAEFARRAGESLLRLGTRATLLVVAGSGAPVELHIPGRLPMSAQVVAGVAGPVVLVADARAGGALASLCGTLALLPASLARRVRGVVLTRAGERGTGGLVRGLDRTVAEVTGLPLLGVVRCPPERWPSDRPPPPATPLDGDATAELWLRPLGPPFDDG
jgi:hypothetical protein